MIFVSCFVVPVTPSINTPEYSIDFVTLIISFISSFERNKVNLFPALTAAFPLISISNFFIVLEAKCANPGKMSLAKGIAMFVSVFS